MWVTLAIIESHFGSRRFHRITGAQLRDGDGDRQGSVGLVDVVPRDLRISDSEGDGVVTGLLRGS